LAWAVRTGPKRGPVAGRPWKVGSFKNGCQGQGRGSRKATEHHPFRTRSKGHYLLYGFAKRPASNIDANEEEKNSFKKPRKHVPGIDGEIWGFAGKDCLKRGRLCAAVKYNEQNKPYSNKKSDCYAAILNRGRGPCTKFGAIDKQTDDGVSIMLPHAVIRPIEPKGSKPSGRETTSAKRFSPKNSLKTSPPELSARWERGDTKKRALWGPIKLAILGREKWG